MDIMWDIEYTNEFKFWWLKVTETQQNDIAIMVKLLIEIGPKLPFPYSSGIEQSRHSHMRELRIQSSGKPLRVFYAFDPRRSAILLIGGNKSGDKRFYETYIPIADTLYDQHLNELRQEGFLE